MKFLCLLLLSSLISYSLTYSQCNPGYKSGVKTAQECLQAAVTQGTGNVCCMIKYLDYNADYWQVCWEIDAERIVHFNNYIDYLKSTINAYYQGSAPVSLVIDFHCSSNYIKMSLLALLLLLF